MNLQQRAMMAQQMAQRPESAFLRDVLDRVSRGMTTSRDADWLDTLITQLEQDVYDLTATIEKEVDHEQGPSDRLPVGAVSA